MSMNPTSRTALIRLASTMPVGSPERRVILAGLQPSQGIAPADPLTKQQWVAILKEMRKGYENSYARMVDDSFGPFASLAKKYGLGDFYDGDVFTFLHRKVVRSDGNIADSEVEILNAKKRRDA